MAEIKRLCVYCGSSTGFDPAFRQVTDQLARELVRRGIGVVYGGAMVGLMGVLADTAVESGGEVIGVVPEALVEREVAHTGLADLRVVGSMHERKATMAELSDGFVALPGGIGTLEELVEVFTWAQLGMHEKACALLNVNGYFDKLVGFLDHAVEEGFMRGENRSSLVVEHEVGALVDALIGYEAPQVTKWLDTEHM